VRDLEGVSGQQLEERFANKRIALGKGHQTLLEFGEYGLRLPGGTPPVECVQRDGNPKTHRENEGEEQNDARTGDAPSRECERVGDEDEDNGGQQGGRSQYRSAAKPCAQP
jgi:hypothetical protein